MTTVDAASAPVAAARPPGRPRSARAEQAIVDATLELLADGGVAGVSMEAVATRAGVGKATIYRRWPSKELLIVDAVATLTEQPRVVHTGSLRGDLLALVETVRRRSHSSLAGRIMPAMFNAGPEHPELWALFSERVLAPRREAFGEVLRRGVQAGELSASLDIEMAVDLIVGSMIYRKLMCPGKMVAREAVEWTVDAVLDGLRPR